MHSSINGGMAHIPSTLNGSFLVAIVSASIVWDFADEHVTARAKSSNAEAGALGSTCLATLFRVLMREHAHAILLGCGYSSRFPPPGTSYVAWAAKQTRDMCDDAVDVLLPGPTPPPVSRHSTAADVAWNNASLRLGYRNGPIALIVRRNIFPIRLQPAESDHLVVTLSTVPQRLRSVTLREALYAIADGQAPVRANRILLNVPDVHRRTGRTYRVPRWLFRVSAITVHMCGADEGPLTKLLPALDVYNEASAPGTRLIVIDDDRLHWPHALELLVRWSGCLPGHAIGFWGVIPGQLFPTGGIQLPRHAASKMHKNRTSSVDDAGSGMSVLDAGVSHVEGLLGDGGYLLPSVSALDARTLRAMPTAMRPLCETHDDLWISSNLAANHIPMAVVPGYVCSWWEGRRAGKSQDWFVSSLLALPRQSERYVKCAALLASNAANATSVVRTARPSLWKLGDDALLQPAPPPATRY